MNDITKLSHQALIDYTYAGMLEVVNDMMEKRQLTASDMEEILEKLNVEVQKKKAIDYALAMVSLTAKIQQFEKEKIKDEESTNNQENISSE